MRGGPVDSFVFLLCNRLARKSGRMRWQGQVDPARGWQVCGVIFDAAFMELFSGCLLAGHGNGRRRKLARSNGCQKSPWGEVTKTRPGALCFTNHYIWPPQGKQVQRVSRHWLSTGLYAQIWWILGEINLFFFLTFTLSAFVFELCTKCDISDIFNLTNSWRNNSNIWHGLIKCSPFVVKVNMIRAASLTLVPMLSKLRNKNVWSQRWQKADMCNTSSREGKLQTTVC